MLLYFEAHQSYNDDASQFIIFKWVSCIFSCMCSLDCTFWLNPCNILCFDAVIPVYCDISLLLSLPVFFVCLVSWFPKTSCCITQVHLSLTDDRPFSSGRDQNSWFLLRCQVIQTWSCNVSLGHPLPSSCLSVGKLFFLLKCYVSFYIGCNGTHTFQKFKLLSHQSTKYFPQSLGDNQNFFANVKWAIVLFFCQQ